MSTPPPPIQSLPSGRSGRGGDFNCGYRTLHGSLPVSEPSLQWVRACFSDIGSSPSLQAAFNGPLLSFIAGAEIVFHVMPVNSAAGKGNRISILLFFVRKIHFFLLSISIFASHNTCFFDLSWKLRPACYTYGMYADWEGTWGLVGVKNHYNSSNIWKHLLGLCN